METTNPDDGLKWIGIDLDCTIAKNSPHPEYALLDPVDGAVKALQDLWFIGWKIVIYTARPWHDHDMIADWLDKYGIPFDQIVCGKLFCKYLIDDRAIHFGGDWNKTIKKIK